MWEIKSTLFYYLTNKQGNLDFRNNFAGNLVFHKINFTFSDLFCKLYESEFCSARIVDYTQKRESGFCLENATMFQIQDMFENGKPDIVLKKVNGLM